MPTYKALILSKEISVNYEENQKDELIDAIKEINNKLKDYDNYNGKISDNKILSFLAIKLQAELLDLKKYEQKSKSIEKKFTDTINENISLKDKVFKLTKENEVYKKEDELINLELSNIKNQLDILLNFIKKTYEE